MNSDDDDFEDFEMSDEELEAFKKEQAEEEQRLKNHPLLVQAEEILSIVDALLESAKDPEVMNRYGSTLQESAMIVIAKLASGLRSKSYVISMQKAAIIRDHAEYLRLSNHLLKDSGAFDKKYIAMFREEMEKFRELFKIWAAEIHRMEPDFEDEDWGLFLKP